MRRRWAGLLLVLICGGAAGAAQAGGPPALSPYAIAPSALAPQDSISDLFAQSTPSSDVAPVTWRSTQAPLSQNTRLRVSLADPVTAPGVAGVALTRATAAEPQAYEISLVRDWPGAMAFTTKSFGVNFSPHAAVGMTPYGGVAEAGARVEVSQRKSKDDAAKKGLGMIGVGDGRRFGDTGRWYLFAAASGRAVGLNMLHGEGGWARAGWTTDQASTLVGDAQVGVGFRKGPMQTSFGVLHREVKGEHLYWGTANKPDTVAGITFAIRPPK
jgi:hypothetical protein